MAGKEAAGQKHLQSHRARVDEEKERQSQSEHEDRALQYTLLFILRAETIRLKKAEE